MTRIDELNAIKADCEELVRHRALISAGAAAIPVPFLDVVVDIRILMKLLPEINQRFDLTPERIESLAPAARRRAREVINSRGSSLIGMVLTRRVIRQGFNNFAGRLLTRQIVKFIPLGGQLVAAGLGYFVMRKLAYRHIEDCYAVAQAIAPHEQPLRPVPAPQRRRPAGAQPSPSMGST